MSTNEPMTREQLNAIQERVNVILARLDAMTVNDSWWSYPLPDPTNERIRYLEKENDKLRSRLTIDDTMLARAQREYEWSGDIRHVLIAALNPEGA